MTGKIFCESWIYLSKTNASSFEFNTLYKNFPKEEIEKILGVPYQQWNLVFFNFIDAIELCYNKILYIEKKIKDNK